MLQVTSDHVELLLAQGHAHLKAHRFEQAEQAFGQVLAINPNHPAVHHALGILFLLTQRHAQAAAAFAKSIELYPTAEAFLNLIQLLHFGGRKVESVAVARAAQARFPDDPRIACEIGRALERAGQGDEALGIYQAAHKRWPTLPLLMMQWASLLFFQGEVGEAVAVYRQAIEANPQNVPLHDALLFTLHFLPGMTAAELLREHQAWDRRHGRELQGEIRPLSNSRDPKRRLRIGYISPDFRNHGVGRFMAPLLAHHDHTDFEIFAYSDVHTTDVLTNRMQAAVDHWRPTFGKSDAQVADLIREDGIDILVDLTMHMPSNRLLVLARKPAPVQVSYLAYASTTGLSAIEYRLSDPVLDPSPSTGAYSEKTQTIPSYWCYEAPLEAPEIQPRAEGVPVTFGCLNNYAKVSPAALETWARILRELPESRLLLHCVEGKPRERVLAMLAGMGVAGERVEFAGRVPLPEFLRLHEKIDIALDPFPYGGGTTTCDALWMGVPVVTLNSPEATLAVGRGGASILTQIGLTDLIRQDGEGYVAAAIALAKDEERRKELRRTLRERMLNSPLMNAPAFARSVEAAYREMWRQFTGAKAS